MRNQKNSHPNPPDKTVDSSNHPRTIRENNSHHNSAVGGGGGGAKDISTIDAAHIHFRDKDGPTRTYRCHSCCKSFEADSVVNVMEHFANHPSDPSLPFHSHCLYCGGKVHRYSLLHHHHNISAKYQPHIPIISDDKYYHDCSRWRRKADT